ncbi:hypothetical protein Hanom_Chr04g00361581 [Helianthus anomalus]
MTPLEFHSSVLLQSHTTSYGTTAKSPQSASSKPRLKTAICDANPGSTPSAPPTPLNPTL